MKIISQNYINGPIMCFHFWPLLDEYSFSQYRGLDRSIKTYWIIGYNVHFSLFQIAIMSFFCIFKEHFCW